MTCHHLIEEIIKCPARSLYYHTQIFMKQSLSTLHEFIAEVNFGGECFVRVFGIMCELL